MPGISSMQDRSEDSRILTSRLRNSWTIERSLTVMLAVLVLHMFVLTPTRFLGQAFKLVSTAFLFFMLAQGILTMVKQAAIRRAVAGIVLCVFLFKFAAAIWSEHWLLLGDALFTLLSLSVLIFIIYQQISGEGPVTAHRIRGAIAEYLLIAMLFAFLYGLIQELMPGAFIIPGSWASQPSVHGEAFYYFSLITLTTVGFGDITPVNPAVRSLVMLEALIGTLYPAIMIARLVTLELETRRSGTGGR